MHSVKCANEHGTTEGVAMKTLNTIPGSAVLLLTSNAIVKGPFGRSRRPLPCDGAGSGHRAPCQWGAPACIEAVAQARYNRKKQAAQAERDAKCKQAEDELFEGLEKREARNKRTGMPRSPAIMMPPYRSTTRRRRKARPGGRATRSYRRTVPVTTISIARVPQREHTSPSRQSRTAVPASYCRANRGGVGLNLVAAGLAPGRSEPSPRCRASLAAQGDFMRLVRNHPYQESKYGSGAAFTRSAGPSATDGRMRR